MSYGRREEEKNAMLGVVNERLNTGIDPRRYGEYQSLIVAGGVYLTSTYGIQYRYTVNRIGYNPNSKRIEATFKAETRGEGHPEWRTLFKAMKRPITSEYRDSVQMIDDDQYQFKGSDYLCMAWEVMAEPKNYEVNYLHADHFGEDDQYDLSNTAWEAEKEYITKADAEMLLDRLNNPHNYTHLAWVEDRLIESVHRCRYEEVDNHWFKNVGSDECEYYNGQGIHPYNLDHTFQIGKEYACGNDTITINAVRLKRANLTHEVAFSINGEPQQDLDDIEGWHEIDYGVAYGSDQRSLTEQFTLFIHGSHGIIQAGCNDDERFPPYPPNTFIAAKRGQDYRYQASTEWRELDFDDWIEGVVQ